MRTYNKACHNVAEHKRLLELLEKYCHRACHYQYKGEVVDKGWNFRHLIYLQFSFWFPNTRFLMYVVNAKLLINFQYVVVGAEVF